MTRFRRVLDVGFSRWTKGRKRRHLAVLAWVAVSLLVLSGAWVALKGYLALRELSRTETLASTLQADLAAGRVSDLHASAQQLADSAEAARDQLSDPLWQLAGALPFVGTNFSTPTRIAEILSDVTDRAVLPLSGIASDLDLSKVKPANGVLDVGAIAAAQPTVARSATVLESAYTEVASMRPAFGALPQLTSAVEKLEGMLGRASQQVSAANTLASTLPSMLGENGPRTYLVLFQNNAELRATGGIPGAAAEIRVDHGRITLGRQAEAKDITQFPQPVLSLADQTKGLYGPIVGQYFQDVNLVPQFPLTARLATEMWKQHFGDHTDGVISLDPIALSYILQATGPVHLPSGETMDSGNAVKLLLSDAYMKYSGVQQKDDFFSTAAAAVFAKVAAGGFQPKAMLDALNRSGSEHRLLVWSPNQKEQDAIQAGNLSGSLPAQTPDRGIFGIYLNDATGAKMDYYLRESYKVGGVMCRADGRPTWQIEVTLSNTAPLEAASTLPEYVTGGGAFGVKPGDVKTQVNVYAPPSAIYLSSSEDGNPLNVHRDMDSGYPVAQTTPVLSPGQSTTLTFQFLGAANAQTRPNLVSTPAVNNAAVSDLSLTCHDVVR